MAGFSLVCGASNFFWFFALFLSLAMFGQAFARVLAFASPTLHVGEGIAPGMCQRLQVHVLHSLLRDITHLACERTGWLLYVFAFVSGGVTPGNDTKMIGFDLVFAPLSNGTLSSPRRHCPPVCVDQRILAALRSAGLVCASDIPQQVGSCATCWVLSL